MTTITERIIDLLPRHESKEISMADIARIIGTTNGGLMTSVRHLTDAGIVFKVCRGRYRLTGKRWNPRRGRPAVTELAAVSEGSSKQDRLRADIDGEVAKIKADKAAREEAKRLSALTATAKIQEAVAARKAARQREQEEIKSRRIEKMERETPFGASYPASAAEKAMRFDHDRKIYARLSREFAV